ncbi:proline dehydrogenase [Desulfosarcina ovata subsp. sediminis]|uniref:proline dehydrogenase n=1 Tax=Desulfosarcina ovata subsp. sediminis TaxID=885957 RepID=A0A5K7ZWC9_9BACT|nr:proline dehydrogenase family protein [Desulfosarcina ovata]BBO84567.1 proline dehydrogenase [Desulfosarcina ovata subsp. sediminis]
MFNRFIAATLPLMPQRVVWLFSRSYIAGDNIDAAMAACRALNALGAKTTIDILGEFIQDIQAAEKNRDEYLALIDAAQQSGIDGNYSVKPTMFGLLIDAEACYRHIRDIVAKAAGYGNFIRIDMEDSACVDREIDLFRRLHAEYPGHVGLVVQAYLRRSRADLDNLMDLHTPATPLNLRLCKGIYAESWRVAFQRHDEINDHFLEDLEFMFQNGIYPGIATHDRDLIDGAHALIDSYRVPPDRYEFQMLYGVTPELRRSIIEAGHTMRVYVPYGRHWFGYATRRLKENPKLVSSIVHSMLFHR